MESIATTDIAAKMEELIRGLREMGQALKAEGKPEMLPLREFRVALDDARLTAWAVSELVNAHQARNNPQKILSFLAAQRVRRLAEMARNLHEDVRKGEVTRGTNGMEELKRAVEELQQGLRELQ